jgi:hypothetical protein
MGHIQRNVVQTLMGYAEISKKETKNVPNQNESMLNIFFYFWQLHFSIKSTREPHPRVAVGIKKMQ